MDTTDGERPIEPSRAEMGWACVIAVLTVALTRWPVARLGPIESDEFGYLGVIDRFVLPPHHTLFLAGGRVLGDLLGDRYRGFVILDMFTSAVAIVAAWWWFRSLVRPSTAVGGAALLAFSPVFWSYGALAGNYTAIVAVGCTLLGIACRPTRAWHPWLAASLLSVGTGYRQDIGTLWLPVFGIILWRHRYRGAIGPLCLFTAINLAWIGTMLWSVGGWSNYRTMTAEFAHSAGYMNSAFHLGVIDAPIRYSVKLVMALVGTFGLALVVVPRGLVRVYRDHPQWMLVMWVSVLPALIMHLTIHFGVAGYAMHYVPALLGLIALGIGRVGVSDMAPLRLAILATVSAGVFLLYPTDYSELGQRRDFDLAFARHTRVGLRLPMPKQGPQSWRTINSARVELTPTDSDRVVHRVD